MKQWGGKRVLKALLVPLRVSMGSGSPGNKSLGAENQGRGLSRQHWGAGGRAKMRVSHSLSCLKAFPDFSLPLTKTGSSHWAYEARGSLGLPAPPPSPGLCRPPHTADSVAVFFGNKLLQARAPPGTPSQVPDHVASIRSQRERPSPTFLATVDCTVMCHPQPESRDCLCPL